MIVAVLGGHGELLGEPEPSAHELPVTTGNDRVAHPQPRYLSRGQHEQSRQNASTRTLCHRGDPHGKIRMFDQKLQRDLAD